MPCNALEQLLLGARSLHDVGLQPQPPRELVLEDEVRLILVADALLHLHVEVLAQLLPDRELGGVAVLGRGADLEQVDVQQRCRSIGDSWPTTAPVASACARWASEICWPSPS